MKLQEFEIVLSEGTKNYVSIEDLAAKRSSNALWWAKGTQVAAEVRSYTVSGVVKNTNEAGEVSARIDLGDNHIAPRAYAVALKSKDLLNANIASVSFGLKKADMNNDFNSFTTEGSNPITYEKYEMVDFSAEVAG